MDPLDRVHPWPVPLSNGSDARSPAAYLAVLTAFQFNSNPRYQPSPGVTWCNIAAADGGFALGALVPHVWSTPQSGQWSEHTANQTIDWLLTTGKDYGWKSVSAAAAKQAAADGLPTLVCWKNPAGHGHLGWVQPDWSLAQAGAKCGYGIPFTDVFTAAMASELLYFVHP